MIIEFNGHWLPVHEKWIRELIEGIPSFLLSHPSLFVGDQDASLLGKPGYMCYLSKPAHTDDPHQTYHGYFQPYHLRDREPLCGIQVEYRLHALDQMIVYVQPMNMSAVYPL